MDEIIDIREKKKILEIKNLYMKSRRQGHSFVRTLEDVSFDIYENECIAILGEALSGKSLLAKAIMRFYPLEGGAFWYDGELISGKIPEKKSKELSKEMQMIFENPLTSLNSLLNVEETISEAIINFKIAKDKTDLDDRIENLLKTVELPSSVRYLYPHELSLSQRQRVDMARALSTEPKILIADEPVSTLDISAGAKVIDILNKIKIEQGISILFTSVDLSILNYIADRIAVLHSGRLVELASRNEIFKNPIHPYTKSLVENMAMPDPLNRLKQNRVFYNPKKHMYSRNNLPEWIEIKNEHFVLLSKDEQEMYYFAEN